MRAGGGGGGGGRVNSKFGGGKNSKQKIERHCSIRMGTHIQFKNSSVFFSNLGMQFQLHFGCKIETKLSYGVQRSVPAKQKKERNYQVVVFFASLLMFWTIFWFSDIEASSETIEIIHMLMYRTRWWGSRKHGNTNELKI